ncbi:MAG: CpsB/CapC family capsule biosynthesis tyrosine phosphatase [Petrimonas sp.]|nr:CpsB/CapC family capsule biosynthesis tyrosine phosphatase [Petrimonas sp.]
MWPFPKRSLLSDSHILDGFTDYHTHLLPGVDDGVLTLEEALEALYGLERYGVKSVWLTPHVMEEMPNTTLHLQARFRELKAAYRGAIELHLAAEYMMDNLFEARLAENDLLPLRGNYLLVETSCFNPPMDMDGTLERIVERGYFPVLAHPERYVYLTMSDFYRLKTIRVQFQLNLPSIAGVYGRTVRITAEKLLQKNLYDFIGSDMHSLSHLRHVVHTKAGIKHIRRLRVLAMLQQYDSAYNNPPVQRDETDKHDK